MNLSEIPVFYSTVSGPLSSTSQRSTPFGRVRKAGSSDCLWLPEDEREGALHPIDEGEERDEEKVGNQEGVEEDTAHKPLPAYTVPLLPAENSEPSGELVRDAERWLLYSHDQTRGVMIVHCNRPEDK